MQDRQESARQSKALFQTGKKGLFQWQPLGLEQKYGKEKPKAIIWICRPLNSILLRTRGSATVTLPGVASSCRQSETFPAASLSDAGRDIPVELVEAEVRLSLDRRGPREPDSRDCAIVRGRKGHCAPFIDVLQI